MARRCFTVNGELEIRDEDGLVLEVDRVYATRIDCSIEPEGVRQEQLVQWMRKWCSGD